MTKMTLMEKLVEEGYPIDDLFAHCSDLYIYDTPLTTRVVDEWFKENQMNKELFVKRFRDQITGRPMYDIAFQYLPYWEEKCRNENNRGIEEYSEPADCQNGC